MQERHWAMRAILAVVLLCTAFTIFGKAQAEPSAETVARGKALTQAADWRVATPPIPQSRSPAASGSTPPSERFIRPT